MRAPNSGFRAVELRAAPRNEIGSLTPALSRGSAGEGVAGLHPRVAANRTDGFVTVAVRRRRNPGRGPRVADMVERPPQAAFEVDVRRHRFLVAVDPGIRRAVRQRAAGRGISAESLVNLWLKEKLAG